MSEIQLLRDEIIAAYKKHYKNNDDGLLMPKESPNGNIMYHLYNTGEVSRQKGGWAYLKRSEFMLKYHLEKYDKLKLHFENVAGDGSTYVILTEEECYHYREKMIELLNSFASKDGVFLRTREIDTVPVP